jgi:hypothetical protein
VTNYHEHANFEHDHDGHLLPRPVRLSDGTDISRMTMDEIAVRQRKLSPKFPDIATVELRRQQMHETIAARAHLVLAVCVGPLLGMFYDLVSGLVVTGFGSVGFITTCIVAGNRAHVRAGGSHGRPGA